MDGKALLPELDQEIASTRRMLERVPNDRLDFRPHEKSYSLLELASHISNLPSWAPMTLTTTELDLDQSFDRKVPTTTEEIVAELDRNAAEARTAIEKATPDDLGVPWTLRMGEQVFFTMPRAAVLRSFVLNHLIHHRAQLGVYLRLLDVPVPGMYGPSADDEAMRA